jgi:hypothetical protein
VLFRSVKSPHPLVNIRATTEVIYNIWNIPETVTVKTRPWFSDKVDFVVIAYNNRVTKPLKEQVTYIKSMTKSPRVVVIASCMLSKVDEDYLIANGIKVIPGSPLPDFTHLDQQTL